MGLWLRIIPRIDFSEVQIILLEAAESLVAPMPANIRNYTAEQLSKMGVDVRLKAAVAEVTPDRVVLKGSELIGANTVVWTAGVRGEDLAGASDIPIGRDGRVPVRDTLQTKGNDHIYVIGDLASIS